MENGYPFNVRNLLQVVFGRRNTIYNNKKEKVEWRNYYYIILIELKVDVLSAHTHWRRESEIVVGASKA